jgi:hypothetical protein
MHLVKIDCREKDWKTTVKMHLQEGNHVDLNHFDYTVDSQFCEMLAISYSYILKLDAKWGWLFNKKPN